MKLYELKRKQKQLKEEILILINRFKSNNCIKVDIERDYNSIDVLKEIEEKSKELEKISFKIHKLETNIKELIIQNDIYSDVIIMLKDTPSLNSKDYTNTYNKTSLDDLIKEYEYKVNKNLDSIEYYHFITEDID